MGPSGSSEDEIVLVLASIEPVNVDAWTFERLDLCNTNLRHARSQCRICVLDESGLDVSVVLFISREQYRNG